MRARWLSMFVGAVVIWMAVGDPARSEPVPTGGPLTLSDAADSFGCPLVAARADGSFMAAWTRYDHDFEHPHVRVRAANCELDRGNASFVDGLAELDTAQLVATREGFSLIWDYGDAGRLHRALSFDLSGFARDDSRAVGAGSRLLSPRPVGGFVTLSLTHGSRKPRLKVRLLDDRGLATGKEFRATLPRALGASLVQRPDGAILVLWQEGDGHGNAAGVLAWPLDSEARSTGSWFRLTSGAQWPLVAWGIDGTIAAGWSEGEEELNTTKVRTFDAGGHPLATAATALEGYLRSLAVNDQGHVLVLHSPNFLHVVASEISPGGAVLGPPVDLTNGRVSCAMAAASGGDWIVGFEPGDPMDDVFHNIVGRCYRSSEPDTKRSR